MFILNYLAGPQVRRQDAVEESWIYSGGHAHAGAGRSARIPPSLVWFTPFFCSPCLARRRGSPDLRQSHSTRAPERPAAPYRCRSSNKSPSRTALLESVAVYYFRDMSLLTPREPEVVSAARVSADFFRVLGVAPFADEASLRRKTSPARLTWRL